MPTTSPEVDREILSAFIDAQNDARIRGFRNNTFEFGLAAVLDLLAKRGQLVDLAGGETSPAGERPADRVFVTFKVTGDGEAGHPMDHVLTVVPLDSAGEPDHDALATVMQRIEREIRSRAGRFMSCPRGCSVPLDRHHSADVVDGGCDTGPMSLADMTAWFTGRGVGQPGYMTLSEVLGEHYGKSEADLEAMYDAQCGMMA